MNDKTVQDYSEWFSQLDWLNGLLEKWSIAHRGQTKDNGALLYRREAEQQFEKNVLPFFKAYENRYASEGVAIRKQHPWLVEFDRRTGTFQKSLEIYRTQPARLSAILSSYTKLLYCETMLLLWCYEDLSGGSRFYDDLKVDRDLARYACASEKINNYPTWRDIGSRVEGFANLIGCSTADETGCDIFSSVNAIQKKCFDTDSSTREMELQAKIDLLTKEKAELEETAREWTRMQSTLSFRHVLEQLPPPSDKREGPNWADFWKKAVDEAKKPGAKNTELAQIVKDYRTLKGDSKDATKNASSGDATKPDPYDHAKVRNTGAGLYNVFSDNIHQYTGHYDLQRSQWDALPCRILKLLTPLDENIEDGKVQWHKERLRFVTPVEEPLAPGASSPAPPNLSASPPSAK